jgi:hypothetical protein
MTICFLAFGCLRFFFLKNFFRFANGFACTEYLWGFPLGQRLRDIRVKGYYLRGKQSDVRRRQLDALGFVWKPQRGRRRNED